MPLRRRDRVEDVHDCEYMRYLEQRLDQLDQLDQRMEQRMDRMMEQFTQQMAALLESQNRRNPNMNSNPDREEIEYDSNFEGGATLFSEENPSDEAFFVAGGDGEPKFDEEEETVTGIGIGAAVTITKSIKELRDLGECLSNLDSGNLDCTRSGPRFLVHWLAFVLSLLRPEVIDRVKDGNSMAWIWLFEDNVKHDKAVLLPKG
ncbi:hypothetical protein CRG98_026411 [Punica granatum]|uniref:Uncharacterized protein n=1 Tax=Punica granatum TaxID=22663 RepID=A0A2I0JBA4_PUNGR|nr:hypothetical protein CRG98_026411 [Punica granatum]